MTNVHTEPPMTEWWAFHTNMAELWSWLEEHDARHLVDGPAYFMEKPWKWNLEYDAIIAHLHGDTPLNSDPADVLVYLEGLGLTPHV